MSKVENIQREVEKLAPSELEAFRKWFYEFDALVWDDQLEEDARAGKLNAIAEKAVRDYNAGKYSEL